MQLFYRVAADVLVVVHSTYVAFVVIGLALILVGCARRWEWTRNIAFRSLHLFAIAIVVGEALFGVTCPLTTWEQRLRSLAGGTSYRGDFLATWVHESLFIDAPPWVFTLVYALFGLAVLATFVLAPPRKRVDGRQ